MAVLIGSVDSMGSVAAVSIDLAVEDLIGSMMVDSADLGMDAALVMVEAS